LFALLRRLGSRMKAEQGPWSGGQGTPDMSFKTSRIPRADLLFVLLIFVIFSIFFVILFFRLVRPCIVLVPLQQ
jgi:hypothetical protein